MPSDTLPKADTESPQEIATRLVSYSRETSINWRNLYASAEHGDTLSMVDLDNYASAVMSFGAESKHFSTLDRQTQKQILEEYTKLAYAEGLEANNSVLRMARADLEDAARDYECGSALRAVLKNRDYPTDHPDYINPEDSLKVADTVEKAVRPFMREQDYRSSEIMELAREHGVDLQKLGEYYEGDLGGDVIHDIVSLFEDSSVKEQVVYLARKLDASKVIVDDINYIARQTFPQSDESDDLPEVLR